MSAAVRLNVPTDYVLLGAGALLTITLLTIHRRQVPAGGDASGP